MESKKRILIVEVNWLGDVLFSTPFIRAIREKYPDSHIACMTIPRTREVLEDNPRINELIIYDEEGIHESLIGKIKLIREIKKKHFDLVIILHRSVTRAFMMYLARIPCRAGYATKRRGFLLTKRVDMPEVEDIHKVDYFLTIARAFECDTSNKNCEFFIKDKEKRNIRNILEKSGVKENDLLVVLNPGGNWPPKRWKEERYAALGDELISRYGVKIAISGAEKDIEKAGKIANMMKRAKPVIFAGTTSLKELGALMERADFVISGDSGPMHIALSVGSKVIALFGPTSPSLTGPSGDGEYRVIQKDVGCEIPCYEFGCRDYKCMDAIEVEDVIKIFDTIYKKTSNRV